MTKNDKILGHVIGVIGGLMIGVVIGVAACMFNLIDINKQEQAKVVETDKENVKNPDNDEEQEDNKAAIAFCEANKDKIYKKIIENRNNSLAAKYDKKWLNSLYKVTSKDDLNCNSIEEDEYGFYELYFDSPNPGYVSFSETSRAEEYVCDAEGCEHINYDFASYLSHEILGDKWGEPNADYWETGILSIYDEELVLVHVVDKNTMFPGELFSIYLVNLKTKTFEILK